MAHTWVTGEIITAKKLNQLEQNVASNTTNVEWARTKINGFDADNDGVVDQAETALDVSNSLMGTIVESQVEFPVAAQGESMKIIIGKFIKWMADARTHMKTSLLTVGTKLSVTNSEVTVNDTIATSDDSKKAANTEYVKANLRRYSSTDDGTVDRARYATVAASCLNVDGHTVEADVPEDAEFTDTVDMAEMVGVLEVSHGGTGKSSVTSGSVLIGNGTSAMTEKAIDTTVTSGSSNLVTSGAVATAIAGGGGGGGSVIYATCPTGSSTTQKVVTTTGGNFTLTTGASLFVKFTYANSASTPTLKVDSTTATGIRGYGTTKPSLWWKAGDVVEFVYDGSYFIMQPSQGQIYTLNNDKQDAGTFGTGYFIIGDTLICYGNTVVGGSGSTSAAMKEITFPQSFSSQPYIVASPASNAAVTVTIHAFPSSTPKTKVQFYSVGANNAWYTAGVSTFWIAIGKA